MTGDYEAKVGVSPELAKIVGRGPYTRISLTRKLWKYINQHNLLHGSVERGFIRPDDALAKILGTRRRLSVYEMTDLVNSHVFTKRLPSSPSSRKAQTRPAKKRQLRRSKHWLWVAKPEFFETPDGSNAIETGPHEGWWTCAPGTMTGDLALLYRAKTRMDISHLIVATTDAFSILEDPFAEEYGWKWGCEFEVLYEFSDPVPLSALRSNKEFWDWGPLKINLQGSAFPIDDSRWNKLIEIALPSNPKLAKVLGRAAGVELPKRILQERHLEDSLASDLSPLRNAGWDLEIWKDPATGRSGRQLVCAAAGGRIDLLCRDRKSGHLVVVELKNVLATEQTYMQTWRYVSWVQRFLAGGKSVSGLVVARGCDSRFELMTAASEQKVRFLSLPEAGFE